MLDQFGRWFPDYPGQQPMSDPAYIRALNAQQAAQMAQTQAQQPVQAPQAQTVQSVPPQTAAQQKIWVKSDRDVMEYYVPPNTSVDIWNELTPHVYKKCADASGKPSTEKYRLIKEPFPQMDAPQAEDAGQQQPQVDLSAFASKTDLEAVAGVVGKLSRDIDTLKDELANMASLSVKRAVGAKPHKDEDED